MLNKKHEQLSIRQQCVLLQIARSGAYYVSVIPTDDSAIANEIHELWLKKPVYGYRKITKPLQRDGYQINHKRVLRIMQEIGIQAIYPKPKTSNVNVAHKKYPYLLEGLAITQTNQVWATDQELLKSKKV